MILTWGQQARPVGLSTLEQVRALKEAAEGAAATAAADAVAAVQPTLDGAVQAAQAARDEAYTATGAVAGTLARADVAAAPKSEGRVWRVGAAAFVAAMGSTAIPDLPDVEPAPWEPVTFQHFRAATDGDDWQPAIMRAQQWSADHGVPVVEPVGLVVDIMQPIEPVSGATVVLPRDFTIRRRFVGGGPGTFMIDDKGAGVSNWHWTGGNLDGGGPDGYPGGIGRFTGTDCTVNSVVAYDYNNNVDASGASMGWLFGGTNVWLRHCDTRVSALGRTQSGTGAYRLNGGTDSGTEGCYGESGDDTFQFVTGSVPAATGFDQSHIRCKHIRPRGKSFTSRAVLAGIGGTQDAQMTCSIIDCLVIDGYFVGTDGRMVNVKNNRSSGLIHGLRFVRCIFDRSQDLSGSTQGSINLVADPTNGGSAAPGSLVLGGIGDVYFEDCRHIGGPTGSAFDIDSGKKLGDGTWLEPTATARIFISGGDWEAPQWGTIDGKVEVHVLKPAKAIVSAGAAAHVVNIGTTYRPNLVDLRLLEIVGVPDGYAGVRVNNAGTVYASRKVSPADGAVTTTGISRSSSGVDHVYLDPDAEITTSIPTSGTMEPIPQLAAALAAIPRRGYTETNNDGTSGYTWDTHGPMIRDISTLTNNRFRNLVTIGPQKVGDVFEISRAGADSGGPWELRVRNGTDTVIAALTVNQWARCVWTGTAWALLSRGSLT